MTIGERTPFHARTDILQLAKDHHIEEAKKIADTLVGGRDKDLAWGVIAVCSALEGGDNAKAESLAAIDKIRGSVFKTNMVRYVVLAFASEKKMDSAEAVLTKKYGKKDSKIKKLRSQMEQVAEGAEVKVLKDRIEQHLFTDLTYNVIDWKKDFFELMGKKTKVFKDLTKFSGRYGWVGISSVR